MRATAPLLLVAACGGLSRTGPDGMVGVLVDEEGAPIAGVDVETVEEPATTDAEGRFQVRYQEPSRYVHLTWHGLWFRRFYRPEDEGTVVRLSLPRTRPVSLDCGPFTCDLTLEWELEEGLRASLARPCTAGSSVSLSAVPEGPPAPSCREGRRPLEVTLEDHGDRLVLGPPPRLVRVELRVPDGDPPADCTAAVGGRLARPIEGEGGLGWTAEVAGAAVANASCDGRPARPELLPADAATVALSWTRSGPWLDLERRAPWAGALVLVAEQGEGAGWTLELHPQEDGRFALPPLAPGTYRVIVEGEVRGVGLAASPPEPARPGVLALAAVDGAEALVGRLVLSADLLAGPIPIEPTRAPTPGSPRPTARESTATGE